MNKFPHFLVILALLVGVIAPACGFAWGNNQYSVIEICTAQGIENRLVENENVENENTPNEPHLYESCAFCFAQNNQDDLDIISERALFQYVTTHKIKARQFDIARLAKSRTPQSPRAPPTLIV